MSKLSKKAVDEADAIAKDAEELSKKAAHEADKGAEKLGSWITRAPAKIVGWTAVTIVVFFLLSRCF